MFKNLFIITLLFVVTGTCFAKPVTINNRTEYSQSLNIIAATMMHWYGSLINNKEQDSRSNIDKQWEEYRSHYPKRISQVFITKTQLLKQDNNYHFLLDVKINHQLNNKIKTQHRQELFIFNDVLSQPPLIESINLISNTEATNTLKSKGYSTRHYKVREFTYAWLSYLDGFSNLNSKLNINAWLNTASYSLTIGADKSTHSIKETLEQRKQLLTKGGHLLHSLTIKTVKDQEDVFIIDLILEWKGVNNKDKPVLASIHQEIKIQIKEDQSWVVLSIKEKHLLPIIAPWMGLLC